MDVVPISLPITIPPGTVNVYLIPDERPALIDAGMDTDACWDALTRALAVHGLAPGDLARVLLTHGHLDHTGLLRRIREHGDPDVYAHPAVTCAWAPVYPDDPEGEAYFHGILHEFGVPEDLHAAAVAGVADYRPFHRDCVEAGPLGDGATVEPFSVTYVPGHSEGDILFFYAESRALFAGDHLLKTIHPNTVLQRPRPGKPRQSSLVQYTESLARTRALGARICYPGHGAPFEDVDAVIARISQRQERKARDVRAVLRDGPATPYETARALFPQLDPAQLFFGLSVAAGYLELLEVRGEAVRHEDGETRYTAA